MHSTPGRGWRLKGLGPLGSTHNTASFSNSHPWNWVNSVNLKPRKRESLLNSHMQAKMSVSTEVQLATCKRSCFIQEDGVP